MATKMSSWEKIIMVMVSRYWRRSIGSMSISLQICDCYKRFFEIDGGEVVEVGLGLLWMWW